MGTIKPSKDQYLVAIYFKVNSKDKKKDKNPPDKKGDKTKSQEGSLNSKKKKGKGEGSKCTYCGKGFHPESSCMKKQIDMLNQFMEKNNVSLPDATNKKEGGYSFKDKERVHALIARTVRSPSFIINSRASRNILSTREVFSSLDDSDVPNILLRGN